MSASFKNNLLIAGNFPSNTGYAWKTIREYFIALGQMFIEHGGRSIICFPQLNGIPERLQSSGIEIIHFDFFKRSLLDIYRFIKKHQIHALYLTDRPVYSIQYLICRIAGVKKIIMHDRTSGDRDTPVSFKKWFKKVINKYPIMSVDTAIANSEFVRQRLIRVNCLPEYRTLKIWNGVDIEKFRPGNDDLIFRRYNIPGDKKIVFAYSRANKYKGIQILIEAAHILVHKKRREDLYFLFFGDGPDLDYFRSLIAQNNLTGYFLCPGKADDIERILKGVSIVVVPSLWQESFGLSVIEGMATGKVVIASKVGGIVEIVSNGEDGYLVPPGDSQVLATKILQVLDNENIQKEIGDSARRTIINRFNIEDKKRELLQVFKDSISEKKVTVRDRKHTELQSEKDMVPK